ncbi:MAG: hypothetical protein M0Z31_03235 [Clostridia bacterium]|nr:hypothetical protein [Clostridia bacterium]
MTIRPVDLQVLMPKVQEVSKIQQAKNQGEHNQQQQFATQLQKESQQIQQQVQNSPKSVGTRITKDQSKQPNDQGDRTPEQRQSKDQENEQAKELKDPKLGKILDIKV